MRIGDFFNKTAYVVGTVLLSCGISQLYGLFKGTVATARYAYYQVKLQSILSLQKDLQTNGKVITETDIKKLVIPPKWSNKLNPNLLLQKAVEKQAKYENRCQRSVTEIKAAALALIPLAGAHLSAKYQGYESKLSSYLGVVVSDISKEVDVARRAFFPGAAPRYKIEDWQEQMPTATVVAIPVNEGKREIEAIYVRGFRCKESDPTVVLYHGNAMTAFEFIEEAEYYYNLGFNVLIPTMGGKQYEQSQPRKNNESCSTSEISLYQDVDGEMVFLKAKGVKEVGVHGLSIGGAKAFQAAVAHPNLVKFVVADKTFTSAQEVAVNIAKDENLPVGRIDAPLIASAFSQAILPQEMKKSGFKTDGLNNLAKAKALQNSDVELFAIEAANDQLMSKRDDGNNFAQDLFKARYNDEQQKAKTQQISTITSGGHGTSFLYRDNVQTRLKTFVKSLHWSSGPNQKPLE